MTSRRVRFEEGDFIYLREPWQGFFSEGEAEIQDVDPVAEECYFLYFFKEEHEMWVPDRVVCDDVELLKVKGVEIGARVKMVSRYDGHLADSLGTVVTIKGRRAGVRFDKRSSWMNRLGGVLPKNEKQGWWCPAYCLKVVASAIQNLEEVEKTKVRPASDYLDRFKDMVGGVFPSKTAK